MGKMKRYWEEEAAFVAAQDEALYASLSVFLNSGGNELGYKNGKNIPDPEDWDDILINEIKAEVYWKLKHHTPGTQDAA